MKNFTANLVICFFTLFLNSQINASGFFGSSDSEGKSGLMAEAIKYAELAKTHKAHPEEIHEYAKMSLEYVKKAEIQAIEHDNTQARTHITESLRRLVEAIKHARMGHARIATEYIDDALVEMYQMTDN
ncbi:Small metal-binding protein [Nitrosomonas aestuarii]|uniref:Small metal-binding protein n=1 Tax=Nitrosomonas aestuarii TaxID=52441 RepID=A0A1I3YS54_9PROT|nr:small metal-binding protein SmbP [Nitrosomonas aestuarii]SFK34590.1 Small metal-binding protein [Nitrosomonas aestuarii]